MPCAWREEWVWKEMEDSMKKRDLAMICDVEHKVIAMSIFFKGQLFLLLNLMMSQKQQ